MSAVVDERITDEIEALEAILMDDVVVKRIEDVPDIIETVVHPSTGDDTDQQFVCVTLEVKLTPEYPDSSPIVTLRNPRGLDDKILTTIHSQIKAKLSDCLGQPVVFELIELIRENLTESNLPSGQCVICLYGFIEGDAFIKTQCYHHFHNHCLASHLIAGKKNHKEELDKIPHWQQVSSPPYQNAVGTTLFGSALEMFAQYQTDEFHAIIRKKIASLVYRMQPSCPVCRCPVSCDVDTLMKAPPPLNSLTAPPFRLTAELKELQKKMAALLAAQVAKGGVVGMGDTGPPPLTITTPEDNEIEEATNGSPGASQEVKVEPVVNERQIANGSNNNSTPGSPQSRPAYRGPYRGFNRRGKPGRRGGRGGSR